MYIDFMNDIYKCILCGSDMVIREYTEIMIISCIKCSYIIEKYKNGGKQDG